IAALRWPTGRVSQPGGKPVKSSRNSSAAPAGAHHTARAKSTTGSRHAIREPVAQSKTIEDSFPTLVKRDRIAHRGGPSGPRLGGSTGGHSRGAAGYPRSAGGLAAVVAALGAGQGDPPARWVCDREVDVRELARRGGPCPPLCTRADPPREGPR